MFYIIASVCLPCSQCRTIHSDPISAVAFSGDGSRCAHNRAQSPRLSEILYHLSLGCVATQGPWTTHGQRTIPPASMRKALMKFSTPSGALCVCECPSLEHAPVSQKFCRRSRSPDREGKSIDINPINQLIHQYDQCAHHSVDTVASTD